MLELIHVPQRILMFDKNISNYLIRTELWSPIEFTNLKGKRIKESVTKWSLNMENNYGKELQALARG